MADVFKNLIGGKWVGAASGKTFEDHNPADRNDLIGSFPRSEARGAIPDRGRRVACVMAADLSGRPRASRPGSRWSGD